MKTTILTALAAAAALTALTATAATQTMADQKQNHMTTRQMDAGEKPLDLSARVAPRKDGAMEREPGELQRKALGDWNKWDPMKGF